MEFHAVACPHLDSWKKDMEEWIAIHFYFLTKQILDASLPATAEDISEYSLMTTWEPLVNLTQLNQKHHSSSEKQRQVNQKKI